MTNFPINSNLCTFFCKKKSTLNLRKANKISPTFLGLTIETVSATNLIIIIGICVDCPAHITHEYMAAKGKNCKNVLSIFLKEYRLRCLLKLQYTNFILFLKNETNYKICHFCDITFLNFIKKTCLKSCIRV